MCLLVESVFGRIVPKTGRQKKQPQGLLQEFDFGFYANSWCALLRRSDGAAGIALRFVQEISGIFGDSLPGNIQLDALNLARQPGGCDDSRFPLKGRPMMYRNLQSAPKRGMTDWCNLCYSCINLAFLPFLNLLCGSWAWYEKVITDQRTISGAGPAVVIL